jgi:hypothetical protein
MPFRSPVSARPPASAAAPEGADRLIPAGSLHFPAIFPSCEKEKRI